MTDLVFYDASTPPAAPPDVDGVAFYLGGDTPHVWTKAEISATRARYRLPIFVRSNPGNVAQALVDAGSMTRALVSIGAPKGILVAWDSETSADPMYMTVVYDTIVTAGYKLLDYGSQSTLFANQLPVGGYYWGADWTSAKHIAPGDAGTQYIAEPDFDLSLFKQGLPFWDTAVSRETSPSGPTLSHGHVVPGTLSRTSADIAWTATGADGWQLTIIGPGMADRHTEKVTKTSFSYTGLRPGHHYGVRVQPTVGGRIVGAAGTIDIDTPA